MLFNEIVDAFDAFGNASDVGELDRVACDVFEKAGFDGYYYITYRPETGLSLIDHRPADWMHLYQRRGYFHCDPITFRVIRSTKPFYWEEAFGDIAPSKNQHLLFEEARGFGLKNGYNIPIHGEQYERAALCLYSGYSGSFYGVLHDTKKELTVLAHMYHSTFQQLDRPQFELPHLTVRESECLTWASRGKTNSEIGTILSISGNTVHAHISAAAKKLGSRTKIHTVVQAIKLRLILP